MERFEIRRREPRRHHWRVIHRIQSDDVEPVGEHGFRIERVARRALRGPLSRPDIAVCDDCLAEISIPADRRYGTRSSIALTAGPGSRSRSGFHTTGRIRPWPASRCVGSAEASTTIQSDRRFHAQPIACADAGRGSGSRSSSTSSSRALGAGVTGVTGTDTDRSRRDGSGRAARRDRGGQGHRRLPPGLRRHVRSRLSMSLRSRKGRSDKPFAVMVARCRRPAGSLVTGRRRGPRSQALSVPIVLLRRRPGSPLTLSGRSRQPVTSASCLPYSPLHHLFFPARSRNRHRARRRSS